MKLLKYYTVNRLLVTILVILPVYIYSQATPDILKVYIDGTSIGVGTYKTHTVEMSSLGEITMKLRVEADNSSVTAGSNGGAWVTVTLDNFTSSSDKSRYRAGSYNNELKYTEWYGAVWSGHPDPYLNSCVAEFELKEGETWSTTGYKNMEVKFTPKSYGDFILFYRAAMSENGGTIRDPSSSPYVDAFGYRANKIKLTITAPNSPPSAPSNPDPYDYESNVSINVDLDWSSSSDPDGDNVDYKVYFGTDSSPDNGEYLGDVGGSYYNSLPTLDYDEHYYWKIIAFDGNGGETEGPVWEFYTEEAKPDFDIVASSASPATINVVNGVPESNVSWSCSVKNIGDTRARISPLGVYMSTSSSNLGTKVDETNIASPYNMYVGLNDGDTDTDNGNFSIPSALIPTSEGEHTRYIHFFADYDNTEDNEKSESNNKDYKSIILNFIVPNSPPSAPANPDPYDGKSNVSINEDLDWSNSSDPDGDNVDYKVYFGTDSSPDNGEYQGDVGSSNFDLPTLDYDQHYYWKIIAFDGNGGETEGPIWDFYTEEAKPDFDIVASSATPATINVVNGNPESNVSWSCSVKNIGDTRARISPLGVYMSTSSSDLGTKVDETNIASPINMYLGLNDGDTDTDNGNFSIPSALIPTSEGQYTRYIHFFADYDNTEDNEKSESNNKDYKSIILNIIVEQPDFDIIASSATPATINVVNGNPESNVSWSCSVKNIGDTRARISPLGVYMSTSSSDLGTKVDETNIASPTNMYLGLNDGDTDTDNGNFSIPSALIPTSVGQHTRYIHFFADYDNTEDNEESESNNKDYKSIILNIIVEEPDLIVINPSINPNTVASDNTITATCTIKNDGDAVANFAYNELKGLSYFISEDDTYNANDIELKTKNLDDFDPNESREIVEDNITIPALSSGPYFIIFYVDKYNYIDESIEENNFSSIPIEIDNGSQDITTVQRTSPSNNDNFISDMSINESDIKVYFTENLSPNSINIENTYIQYSGGDKINCSLDYTDAGTVYGANIKYTFNEPLIGGQYYELIISGNIKDKYDNSVQEEKILIQITVTEDQRDALQQTLENTALGLTNSFNLSNNKYDLWLDIQDDTEVLIQEKSKSHDLIIDVGFKTPEILYSEKSNPLYVNNETYYVIPVRWEMYNGETTTNPAIFDINEIIITDDALAYKVFFTYYSTNTIDPQYYEDFGNALEWIELLQILNNLLVDVRDAAFNAILAVPGTQKEEFTRALVGNILGGDIGTKMYEMSLEIRNIELQQQCDQGVIFAESAGSIPRSNYQDACYAHWLQWHLPDDGYLFVEMIDEFWEERGNIINQLLDLKAVATDVLVERLMLKPLMDIRNQAKALNELYSSNSFAEYCITAFNSGENYLDKIDNRRIRQKEILFNMLQYSTLATEIAYFIDNPIVEFEVSPDNLVFSFEAGQTKSANLLSSLSWDISDYPDWLSINPQSGTGNDELVITTLNSNTSNAPYDGNIKVINEFNQELLIHITQQNGEEFYGMTDKESLDFNGTNYLQHFNIFSNSNWEITTNDDWIFIDQSNGFGDSQIEITLNPFENEESRNGTIIVNFLDFDDYIEIVVNQEGLFLIVTETLELPTQNSTQVINVNSNVTWEVSLNENWLQIDGDNQGFNDGGFVLVASQNEGATNRSAIITINGAGLVKEISVTQLGTCLTNVSHNIPNVLPQTGGNYEVTFNSNDPWTSSLHIDEILINEWSGDAGNGIIEINIPENNDDFDKAGVLKIFSCDIEYTIEFLQNRDDEQSVPADNDVQYVTITDGEDDCFDATNTITVAGSGTTVDINSGGEATFIAGEKIHFQPGFTAHGGSYMQAYITTTGEYCSSEASMMANNINSQEIDTKAITATDVIDNYTRLTVSIYPNPTTGNFTVDFMGKETNAEIKVLNFQGTNVSSLDCNNQTHVEININYLPAGMYIVIIKTDTEVIKKKVIKIK